MNNDTRISDSDNPHRIEAGDTVAFAPAYLKRVGLYFPDMALARGVVNALYRLPNGWVIADVAWDRPRMPKRIMVANLTVADIPDYAASIAEARNT